MQKQKNESEHTDCEIKSRVPKRSEAVNEKREREVSQTWAEPDIKTVSHLQCHVGFVSLGPLANAGG